jgi:putrescine transport system ATP-binding protein
MTAAPRTPKLTTKPPAAFGKEDFVRVVGVSMQFGSATAVDRLDLAIRQNELFALLGSSGCGKSTLLRMLAGLQAPTAGRIWLDGEDITDVPAHKRPVNMMFQSYALFPHMTAAANMMYGLKREGVPAREAQERVDDALDLVQMRPYAQRMPSQLSGGQQQRVALARSLVKRPKLLLLDEPMSALDKKIRQETQFELGNILSKVGVTCVLVTHDQEEAMTMADRIAVMSAGRIVQMGSPEEIYETPQSRFAAEFIGSTNIFTATLAADGSTCLTCADLAQPLELAHPVDAAAGTDVSISLRPERVTMSLAPPPDAIAGESNVALGIVEQIAYMGSYSLYHVRLLDKDAARRLVVSASRAELSRLPRRPDYDDTVLLRWPPDALVVLKS